MVKKLARKGKRKVRTSNSREPLPRHLVPAEERKPNVDLASLVPMGKWVEIDPPEPNQRDRTVTRIYLERDADTARVETGAMRLRPSEILITLPIQITRATLLRQLIALTELVQAHWPARSSRNRATFNERTPAILHRLEAGRKAVPRSLSTGKLTSK